MSFCSGCRRGSSVRGFVIRQTSLCLTMDCANSVSYCVTVSVCCLVAIIVLWNKRTL